MMTKCCVLFVILSCGSVAAQENIVSPRPLADASDLLQESWAKPVTYEDPVWLWDGDLETDKQGVKWSTYPKRRSAKVPLDALKNLKPNEDAGFVTRIVNDTNDLSDGPRFAVRTSDFGIHIVPLASAEESGQMKSVVPLLDQEISVPQGSRTPEEHLTALCAAITASSGMKVQASTSALGLKFNFFFVGEESQQFVWGVPLANARDALIDLLSRSASTFSWRLNCQPDASPADRFCVLNIVPITVSRTNASGNTVRDAILFDRCERCPKRFPRPPQSTRPSQ